MTRARLAYAISLALSTYSTSGFAQDTNNQILSINNDQHDTTLPTVSVVSNVESSMSGYTTNNTNSATGLNFSPLETPQTIIVFTEQRLADQNLKTVNEVLANTPGISVKEYDSARQYYFARGFEVKNIQNDGIPTMFNPGWGTGESDTNTAMYERIEIIKGATGLLSGTGDPSAAINLVRKRADSNQFEGKLEAGFGNNNQLNATVDLNSPLNASKTFRGRIIASHDQQDSFRDIGDSKKSLFYSNIEADLSDKTLLSLGFSLQDNVNNGPTWGGLPAWYDDGSRTNWDRSKTTSADWTNWTNSHQNYFASLDHTFANNWSLKTQLSHGESTSASELLYVYGNPNKTTGLGISAWTGGKFSTDTDYTSLDMIATGNYSLFGKQHEATIGASHAIQNFTAHSHNATSVAPIGNFNEWSGKGYPKHVWGPEFLYEQDSVTQSAAYAASRLNITDKMKVIAGARLTNWEKDRKEAAYNNAEKISHSSILTPYLGLVYNLDKTYSAYASYTSIFNPQNERNKNGDNLEPIVGTNSEVGLKAALLDGRLTASAALFKIEQDNLAKADGTNTIPGTADQAYTESKGATSQGYEIEVVGDIRDGWDISFGWTSYTLKDANGDDINTEQPRDMLKIFTSYKLASALNKLTLGGGVNWESEGYANTTNPVTTAPEKLKQDAFYLVSLMAKYEFSKQLQAQLNVNNLLDETYYTNIGTFGQIAYGSPRTVAVNMNYTF